MIKRHCKSLKNVQFGDTVLVECSRGISSRLETVTSVTIDAIAVKGPGRGSAWFRRVNGEMFFGADWASPVATR